MNKSGKGDHVTMSAISTPREMAKRLLQLHRKRVLDEKRERGQVASWTANDQTEEFVLDIVTEAIILERAAHATSWEKFADACTNVLHPDQDPQTRLLIQNLREQCRYRVASLSGEEALARWCDERKGQKS